VSITGRDFGFLNSTDVETNIVFDPSIHFRAGQVMLKFVRP